jgi:hypothetical protein
MVNITLVEVHMEDGSISANFPFSGVQNDENEQQVEEEDDEDSGGSKGLAIVGVFLFLVAVAALVKYLSGDDDADVAIDTDDESVDVSIDD